MSQSKSKEKKTKSFFSDQSEREFNLQAVQWGAIGGMIAYIIVIFSSFYHKIDTTAANFMMTGMLVFNRGYFMINKKGEVSRLEKIGSALLIIGGVVMLVGFLGSMIK